MASLACDAVFTVCLIPAIKKIFAFDYWNEQIQKFPEETENLKVTINSIEQHRGQRDSRLIEKLAKGKDLTERCLNVPWWNLLVKICLLNEVRDLQNYLKDYLPGGSSDVTQVAETVPSVNSTVDELEVQQSSSSSSSGSHTHHQVSFRDDVSVDKYSYLNGFGKTTLSEEFDLKLLQRAKRDQLPDEHMIFGKSYLYHAAGKKMVIKESIILDTVDLRKVEQHKKEFKEIMEKVGSINNPYVVPVRAYYFSEIDEQRLIVYDFDYKGSLHYMLHDEESRPLPWDARVKIATGVAKAIAHIHAQDDGKLVHGNIKSTNIFVNAEGDGCLSDLGQSILFPPTHQFDRKAHKHLDPETADGFRKTTQLADIYSYGTLLVELLYGEIDVSLIKSNAADRIADVHLKALFRSNEVQWKHMRQIAMKCTSLVQHRKLGINRVLTMLEQI